MEQIKATPINDPLFDYAIDIVDPASLGSARIAKVLIKADADDIVQAVNSYDEAHALLEQFQLLLANPATRDIVSAATLSHNLRDVRDRVNAAVLQHHEYLESQI